MSTVQMRSSRDRSTPIRSNVSFHRTPERHFLHPQVERPISPEHFKREKSPFELGDSVDLQVYSSAAIIDKASVMDISNVDVKNVDEYIQLFLTEYCVIDRAGIEDISEPSVRIMVVEEDEDAEKKRTGRVVIAPMPLPEEPEVIQEESTNEPVNENVVNETEESDSQDKKKLRLSQKMM
jgi:hypothetical protein